MGIKRFITKSAKFQNTDLRILQTMYHVLKNEEFSVQIKNRHICRLLKINRSTIYIHCRNVNHLIKANSQEICRLASEVISHTEKQGEDYRFFLRLMMIRIAKNNIRFGIEYYSGSRHFGRYLAKRMRPIVTKHWESYDSRLNVRIYRQYCAEFIGILRLWGDEELSIDRLDHYLYQLNHITALGPKRYLELCGKR